MLTHSNPWPVILYDIGVDPTMLAVHAVHRESNIIHFLIIENVIYLV